MNKIDRNKILVRHIISLGLAANQKELGLLLGYSHESSFSQIINEKVVWPKDLIKKLKKLVPDLNEEWLLTGEGSMLHTPGPVIQVGSGNINNVSNSTIDNRHYYSDSPDVLRAEIDKLDRIIAEKEDRIAEKDKQIAEKDKQIAALIAALSK